MECQCFPFKAQEGGKKEWVWDAQAISFKSKAEDGQPWFSYSYNFALFLLSIILAYFFCLLIKVLQRKTEEASMATRRLKELLEAKKASSREVSGRESIQAPSTILMQFFFINIYMFIMCFNTILGLYRCWKWKWSKYTGTQELCRMII